jgi:hypothetical protein
VKGFQDSGVAGLQRRLEAADIETGRALFQPSLDAARIKIAVCGAHMTGSTHGQETAARTYPYEK